MKTLLSPAKVNLYLKVLSRRPDGYHNIRSIVDLISLCDRIHIEDIAGDEIIVDDDKGVLPRGEGNTVYRAIRMLSEAACVRRGIHVSIEKHIPIGSGLGGPSSNAATVLKELCAHWELALSSEELSRIGSRVGADVPLFLHGNPCIMEGTGDRITPIELPLMWYVVVYPNVSISTKAVYEGLKMLTKEQNDIKLRGNFSNPDVIAGILENDLERVAISMCPQIEAIKDALKKTKALGSLMSGSGSSVFAIFGNEEDAKQASLLSAINKIGTVFIAHSVQGG